jgi:hypothetical protein
VVGVTVAGVTVAGVTVAGVTVIGLAWAGLIAGLSTTCGSVRSESAGDVTNSAAGAASPRCRRKAARPSASLGYGPRVRCKKGLTVT